MNDSLNGLLNGPLSILSNTYGRTYERTNGRSLREHLDHPLIDGSAVDQRARRNPESATTTMSRNAPGPSPTTTDGDFVRALHRLVAWLDRSADTLDQLSAHLDRHRRHHPLPLTPGMVTWPTRRRRHRRTR